MSKSRTAPKSPVVEEGELIPEYGEWFPRRREPVTLPANLPREVHRLVWWLQDIGCVRSPYISHPDCFDVPNMRQESMCGRCRALRPYHGSGPQAADSKIVPLSAAVPESQQFRTAPKSRVRA